MKPAENNFTRLKWPDRKWFLDFTAKSLTPRYLAALGTIALLSIAGQILVQGTLSGQTRDNVQRDLANDQRGISHKLGRTALSIQLSTGRNERNQSLAALKEGLGRLKQVHSGLVHGDAALNVNEIRSKSGKKALEGMQTHFTGLVKAAEGLIFHLEHRSTRPAQAMELLWPARKLVTEETEYRRGLDTLIAAIDADSARKVSQLRWMESSLLILTLVTLLLEGLFIFRPAVQKLKKAILDLEGSEARKRAVLDASPESIVTLDAAGLVIEVNPATEKLFGRPAETLLGKRFSDLALKEEYRREFAPCFAPVSSPKGASSLNRKFEFPAVDAAGEDLLLEGMVTPTFAGSRPVFTAFLSNLTQKKRAERELRETIESLNDHNEELQRFTYVASHDLQEPLRMISSYVTLLSRRYRDKLDQDARDFVDFTVDGATRMQHLIVDLLNYSRLQTGPVQIESVDCEAVLDGVLKNLSLAIQESGARIERGSLPKIMGNPSQIGQLFQNLLGNSIKYRGEASPVIAVTADRDGPNWIFSFTDNGIGFDMEYANRIFEPFQRLHGKSEYSGSGIGLAICKKVADSHGGRIWAVSESGRGSTFFVALPAGDPKHPALKKPAVDLSPASSPAIT